MEIKVYPETIDGVSNIENLGKDVEVMSGVYLHGKLQEINGYDIVDRYHDDNDPCQQDQVIPVTVVMLDGTEYKAFGYFWKSPDKYEFYKTFLGELIPTQKVSAIQRGLICAWDDKEANEYALEKFNARSALL